MPRTFEEQYLDHLRVERGLAPRTLVAYGHDLARLFAFAKGQGRDALELSQQDISAFMTLLRSQGLGARSVARAVHAIRGFYRFAIREERLQRDPMENLKAPRAFQPLPRHLTMGQVDDLLTAPDVSSPLGLRDRAMLEVL